MALKPPSNPAKAAAKKEQAEAKKREKKAKKEQKKAEKELKKKEGGGKNGRSMMKKKKVTPGAPNESKKPKEGTKKFDLFGKEAKGRVVELEQEKAELENKNTDLEHKIASLEGQLRNMSVSQKQTKHMMQQALNALH
jgi:hypothetical protein